MVEVIASGKTDLTKVKKTGFNFNIYVILFALIAIIVLFNLFRRNEKIEAQYLKKGVVTYFNFDGELGDDRSLVFIATGSNVDFEIITEDGAQGKPWKNKDSQNNGSYLLKSHHRGVYIVSHNKDTYMNVSFKKIK